jgi:hypothetical protein
MCALLHGSATHNDIVDGDVHNLDEESNEAHDQEANSCGSSNAGKFYT